MKNQIYLEGITMKTRTELCAKKQEAIETYGKIGKVTYCEPYGNGHINDTFLTVTENGKRYIFQRINHLIGWEDFLWNQLLILE